MKKGFFHILEIVIVTLVMFVVVFQFSAIPSVESDWSRAKLSLKAWDVIQTLSGMGTDWLDPVNVSESITSAINSTNIRYSVYADLPKSLIQIGCFRCTAGEVARVQLLIHDFEINDIDMTFGPVINTTTFSVLTDVTIVFDANLTDYEADLVRYLESGRGVVQMRHFDRSEIEGDPVQSRIFGLSWDDTLPARTDDNITFPFYLDQDSRYYPIKSYFHHIQNSSGDFFDEPHIFNSTMLAGEKLNLTDTFTERIVLMQEGTNLPACIVREGIIGGSGRTVWLADGPDEESDKEVLFVSLVSWASLHQRVIVENEMARPIGTFTFFTVLSDEMYQPVEINMELGYLY
jgi:hypothetical protein